MGRSILVNVGIISKGLFVAMASVFWSCHSSASEMRVLVETIVGEPDEVVPPPELRVEESSSQPTNRVVKAEDGRGSRSTPATDANYEVSVTHAFSQLLTEPSAARTGDEPQIGPGEWFVWALGLRELDRDHAKHWPERFLRWDGPVAWVF